ncbi:MAG: ATP-grasp domain-containing protein, partial [Gammaproteobacteria bacterium]
MSVAIKHEYFPSCKHVINHDTTNCAAYDGVGNHLYSGRALGLSEPWDIIQLHPDLQPLWDDIRNHYRRIGLSHTDDVVWNLDLKYVASRIGYQPSVFYYGKNECKYWGDQEWLETAEFINSKNNFVALANELGIDVPDTLRFESAFNIWTDDIKNIEYPCFLKAAVPRAGNMFKRFKNESQLLDAIADIPGDIPLQIQKEIKAESFINLQY